MAWKTPRGPWSCHERRSVSSILLLYGVLTLTADHPHGGGRGKSKGNVKPVSPWGVPVSIAMGPPCLFSANTNDRRKEVTRPDTRGTSTPSLSRTESATRVSAGRSRVVDRPLSVLSCTISSVKRSIIDLYHIIGWISNQPSNHIARAEKIG
jgi:hypothetical protein